MLRLSPTLVASVALTLGACAASTAPPTGNTRPTFEPSLKADVVDFMVELEVVPLSAEPPADTSRWPGFVEDGGDLGVPIHTSLDGFLAESRAEPGQAFIALLGTGGAIALADGPEPFVADAVGAGVIVVGAITIGVIVTQQTLDEHGDVLADLLANGVEVVDGWAVALGTLVATALPWDPSESEEEMLVDGGATRLNERAARGCEDWFAGFGLAHAQPFRAGIDREILVHPVRACYAHPIGFTEAPAFVVSPTEVVIDIEDTAGLAHQIAFQFMSQSSGARLSVRNPTGFTALVPPYMQVLAPGGPGTHVLTVAAAGGSVAPPVEVQVITIP